MARTQTAVSQTAGGRGPGAARRALPYFHLRLGTGCPGGGQSDVYWEGVSKVPSLSNAEAAGIRTRHGRRRRIEDDPFLLNINSGLGIDGKRYGEGIHEGRFDLAH